jgi:uncharacterized surface protein with fasciclin (FAS1) repeats
MSIGRFIKAAAATVVLASTAPAFAQLNGPFYTCLNTDLVEFDGTIVDAAVATPELSTLVTAVTAAGLVDALATTEGITVYAPTDEAFAAVPSPILDSLLADTDLLTEVLTYHVTAQPSWKADPRRGSSAAPQLVETLQGQTLTTGFRPGMGAMVNQSTANCQGVSTDNGIVWIINSVLLPQF